MSQNSIFLIALCFGFVSSGCPPLNPLKHHDLHPQSDPECGDGRPGWIGFNCHCKYSLIEKDFQGCPIRYEAFCTKFVAQFQQLGQCPPVDFKKQADPGCTIVQKRSPLTGCRETTQVCQVHFVQRDVPNTNSGYGQPDPEQLRSGNTKDGEEPPPPPPQVVDPTPPPSPSPDEEVTDETVPPQEEDVSTEEPPTPPNEEISTSEPSTPGRTDNIPPDDLPPRNELSPDESPSPPSEEITTYESPTPTPTEELPPEEIPGNELSPEEPPSPPSEEILPGEPSQPIEPQPGYEEQDIKPAEPIPTDPGSPPPGESLQPLPGYNEQIIEPIEPQKPIPAEPDPLQSVKPDNALLAPQPLYPPEPKGNCYTEKLETLKNGFMPGLFVPHCHDDGTWEPLQCHGSTGQCWCVDQMGKEVTGTRTEPGRPIPQCNGHGDTKGRPRDYLGPPGQQQPLPVEPEVQPMLPPSEPEEPLPPPVESEVKPALPPSEQNEPSPPPPEVQPVLPPNNPEEPPLPPVAKPHPILPEQPGPPGFQFPVEPSGY